MSEQNFMNELQKQILKYGAAAVLLSIAVWYQTDQLTQIKKELKDTDLRLLSCETERAKLTERVDAMGKELISLKAAAQISRHKR
jgi:hypothetical protein